jgi:hypothetical protein
MFGLEQKPNKHIKPGKWYITVDCVKCDKGIAIEETPTPIVQYRHITDLKCSDCGRVAAYAPASMSCRQGPKIVHRVGSKSAT